MSPIDELKKLIVSFLLDNKIALTLDFYLIDFLKINNIFTFFKSVYLVFFQKLDNMWFYKFIQYVLQEFYGYQFVEYKYVKNQKPQIPDCLKFESNQFEIYLIIQQKPDGKLSIRQEFSLKLNTVHQGKERRYVISRLISEGTYGKVYLCVDEHGNQFAMKLFQSKDEMDVELKALHHLKDIEEVINSLDEFYFSLLDIKFGAFVMPFMTYTLKSFIENYNLPEDFMLRVFYQLLCELHKIHHMGCFHMDIKPENILIDDASNQMKLTDFGLSEILPKGTHYATTPEAKITSWYRCPVNALAEANGTPFHVSWIGDFFALSVSIISMIYMSSCDSKSRKYGFSHKPTFNIFTRQQYFKSKPSNDKSPKKIDVDLSKIRIEIACRTVIKNPFFCNILMEYMNPESVLRWYSELQKSPENNSVIPEVIAKIKTYFRIKSVLSELNARFKKSESDVETPPCPHVSSP
jgi:serine/threonine protein kinase